MVQMIPVPLLAGLILCQATHLLPLQITGAAYSLDNTIEPACFDLTQLIPKNAPNTGARISGLTSSDCPGSVCSLPFGNALLSDGAVSTMKG